MQKDLAARSDKPRVLFITGAGSGSGLETTRRALAEAWSVFAIDLNLVELERIEAPGRLLTAQVDVTSAVQVADAVARAERELGAIDRVVHAAAIMPLGPLASQSGDLINKVMSVNYGGLVNVAQAVMPRLRARRRGEFVSYASLAGHVPLLYMGAYDASKFAVAAFTEVLHQEARGSGVRIVCVCPPPVATPLLNQARSTTWPRMFDISPPITATQVIDAIEAGLRGKAFWIFPGPLTAILWRLRRWTPSTLWRFIHRIERR